MAQKPFGQRKLILVLAELPPEKIHYFKNFLLLNPDLAPLVKFVSVLQSHVLNSKEQFTISAEQYYNIVFPKLSFNNNTLHSAFSKIWDALFDFMALEQHKEQTQEHPRLVMDFINKNLEPLGDKAKYIQSHLEKKVFDSLPVSSDSFLRTFEYLFSLSTQLQYFPQSFDVDHWEKLNTQLDHFYLSKKLEVLIATTSFHLSINKDWENEPIGEFVISFVAENLDDLPEIIRAYLFTYYLYLPDRGLAKKGAELLKPLLVEEKMNFPLPERKGLFSSLFNFAILQVVGGDWDSQIFADELIDFGIDSGLVFHNGRITSSKLKTILSFKCRMGKVAEAENILSRYKDKMVDLEKGKVAILLKTVISYYKKDYDQALEFLHSLKQYKKFQDGKWLLEEKIFEILARLARNSDIDSELIPFRIDSYKQFLNRNKKLSSQSKKAYKDFLVMTLDIYKAKDENDKEKLEEFRSKAKSSQTLINKLLILHLVESFL